MGHWGNLATMGHRSVPRAFGMESGSVLRQACAPGGVTIPPATELVSVFHPCYLSL